MHNLPTEFWLFLCAVAEQYVTIAAGCAVTVMIDLIAKHFLKRPLSYREDVAILGAFVFFGCFLAWRAQYEAIKPVATPPIQVNLDTPSYLHVDAIGSVTGYTQIEDGKQVALDVYFKEEGITPVANILNFETLTIGTQEMEPQLKKQFQKELDVAVANAKGTNGVSLVNHGFFNTALSPVLTVGQAREILKGKQRFYLQIWASWGSENGAPVSLRQCEWIMNPPKELQNFAWHSCDP